MAVIRHRGQWTLEDRCASPYHYLPVPVPPGTAGLRVDAGLRPLRRRAGPGLLRPGRVPRLVRRRPVEFVITARQATPGYLPGELEPGDWQVALGLYQLPKDGVSYTVTAELTSTPGRLRPGHRPPPAPLSERPPRRELPARPGHRWLAGDLHTHTVHSDGALTVPELARLAAEQGLDFLAVTDHNTVSHHPELAARGPVRDHPAPGPGGHHRRRARRRARRRGLDRLPRAPGDVAGRDRARRRAAVGQPPDRRACQLDASDAAPPPLVEVWHWSWLDLRWTTPLAWWLAWDPGAIPVGGSDWHRPGSEAAPGTRPPGSNAPTTGAAAVLDGLRDGRCAISARRDGPVLLRAGRRVRRGGRRRHDPGRAGRPVRRGARRSRDVPGRPRLPPPARPGRRDPGPHRLAAHQPNYVAETSR